MWGHLETRSDCFRSSLVSQRPRRQAAEAALQAAVTLGPATGHGAFALVFL